MKRRSPVITARRRAREPLRARALIERAPGAPPVPLPSGVSRSRGPVPRGLREPRAAMWGVLEPAPEPAPDSELDPALEPEVEPAPEPTPESTPELVTGLTLEQAWERALEPAPVPAPLDRPRRSARLVAVAAVLVVLVGALVGAVLLYANRDEGGGPRPRAGVGAATAARSPASTSATQPAALTALNSAERAALAWMTANVSKTAGVLADRGLATALAARGFSAVRTSATGSLPTYVVADAALPATPTTSDVLARAVPLARFGSAGTRVEVRSVLRAGPEKLAALVAADNSNRVQAGGELASNSKLGLNDAARTLLRAGGLDLRPAAFLALVAADRDVRVVRLPIAAAEAALARPVRTVTLAVTGDDAAAIRSAAAALPPEYAPLSVTSTRTSITLTWAPTARAVQAVT